MSEFLDELARTIAKPMPRSTALRLLGGALIAGAFGGIHSASARPTPLGLRRATADCPVPNCDWPTCPPRAPKHCCQPNIGNDKKLKCRANGCCTLEETCCKSGGGSTTTCCLCGCGPDGINDTAHCKECPVCAPVGVERADYRPDIQCCTPYGVEPKFDGFSARACRNTLTPRPGYKRPAANGCGTKDVPVQSVFSFRFRGQRVKVNFTPACNNHDKCYDTCTKETKEQKATHKESCDDKLRDDMEAICKKAFSKGSKALDRCTDVAAEFHLGVGLAQTADKAYWRAQSQACHCCD